MRFPSRIRLSEDTRSELITLLNGLLATSLDLYSQVKHAHWNVRGSHFLSRHELFDDLAKHLREQSDALAERLAALGGYAEGTVRLVARNSTLAEYDLEAIGGDDHLEALAEAFGEYCGALREGINRCAEVDDPVTEDLLTQTLGASEQDLWFLESHFVASLETRPVRPRRGRARPSVSAEDAESSAEDAGGEASEGEASSANGGGRPDANREGGAETADPVDEDRSPHSEPWSEPMAPPH